MFQAPKMLCCNVNMDSIVKNKIRCCPFSNVLVFKPSSWAMESNAVCSLFQLITWLAFKCINVSHIWWLISGRVRLLALCLFQAVLSCISWVLSFKKMWASEKERKEDKYIDSLDGSIDEETDTHTSTLTQCIFHICCHQ